MLRNFPRLFAKDYTDVQGVDAIQHKIELKPEINPKAQVGKLLEIGFIYPVENSQWVSPIVVTLKKNGKWRVCVDYRPLNEATKRDHFPLPFQEEILNEVAGKEKYTLEELESGDRGHCLKIFSLIYSLILGMPWLMEVNVNQKWESGKLVLQKGKRIVYDMKLGKQSNTCFETNIDEESKDESSYGDGESWTSEESSMEVMGPVFQQPQAKGSSTSKEVEVVAQEEPILEERLRKMLDKDLTKEEEEDYINMFKRYPHLFNTDYSMIKGVDVIQHHIDLKPDAKPVAQKLRSLGVVQQEALLTEVNKLLKVGFIYLVTNFEWVSPVVVTPKKDDKWRVCVDYKPLNAATKRDHFPLPFQDEILNEVAGHERYTICDGYSGYYQICIVEEDKHKTTLITPWGCFAFRVMPFGLTNAPSTFTRFTSLIFQPFFGKSIRVFLDDFCTYSDRALHCQRVEEGLQRLYQYGGKLNPDKCHVDEKEVVLLGHVFSQEGIKIDPSHVQAILNLPPPNSARQVITFVQKVRYMSGFIHLLFQIISPLQQLANQEVFS
ncbi:hypothetical protein L7F22_026121 [Adiantum nelumboides]|nr:hypothetical protein [Adiantum nelumboides]